MRFAIFLTLSFFLTDAEADPRSHYLIHCMGCHLVDGAGVPPEVPTFNHDLAFLAGTVEGRRYLVQVPGATQSPIDDAALAALLNWMLARYAPGESITPYSESEISEYRKEILADPISERARLFAAKQ